MLVGMRHGLTKALGAGGGGLDCFQVNIKSEEAYVAVPHLQKVFCHTETLQLETVPAHIILLVQLQNSNKYR